MKLNAPKKIVWNITLIAGILGIILHLVPIAAAPFLSLVGFTLVAAAWLLLILSTVLKGL